jgi:hypothetical protein
MNRLLVRAALPALLALMVGCGTTTQTRIPAGQTFVLGGEQQRELLLEGRNTGPVPLELLRERAGVRSSLAMLAPGQLFSRRFSAGDRILLRNASADQVGIVDAQFDHAPEGLTMRYEAAASPAR